MPAPKFVDLHIHTTASDGSDTPKEVVQKAHAKKLAAIAITDHDTLGGLAEAEDEGQRLGIEIIRGCEISVSSEYGEIHLLGLWIPKDSGNLEQELKKVRAKRQTRNQRIIERCQDLGIPITLEEVMGMKANAHETLGRPHMALLLLKKGIVRTTQEAFQKYLGYHGTAFVPKDVMTPEEAIHTLTDIGATVSLAHCMLIQCPKPWLDSTVGYLKSLGLSAIEAYHSSHDAKAERFCVDMAARHGLALTGGSDYHGPNIKPGVQLGRGKGNLRVTVALLDNLKAHRLAKALPV